ncbi:unnamed protein product [Periconia digitata]|uniref:WD40 repeat-like protein n=1 Tax=Periconia digitata TaxID=1303443 RepID=A0A9W4U2D8_9PLEO|nr:unnamed protein product [Periconia digitata]
MSVSSLRVGRLASTTAAPPDTPTQQEQNMYDGNNEDEPMNRQEESVRQSAYSANCEDAEESSNNTSDDDEEESETMSSSSSSSSSSSEEDDEIPTNLSTINTSCIEEAQLSPDGTCIFTTDHARRFSVYAMPTTTTTGSNPANLKPYAQLQATDPIWAFASNPYFDLYDSSTTTVLLSQRDHYITLHNALWDISNTSPTPPPHGGPINISPILTSYKLINSLTEAYITPLSLTYTHSGTHFYAGHQNTISIFDVGESSAPISNIPTIPSKRSILKGGGVGFKGHITSLSLSPSSLYARDGILAAGSRTRWIGLYDSRTSEAVTSFSLPGGSRSQETTSEAGGAGGGVTQLKWMPDGNYLCIAERRSDTLLFYDARNYKIAVSWCTDRNALTNQKVGFDIWSPEDSSIVANNALGAGGRRSGEVWGGGTDGSVRVWTEPWNKDGAMQPDRVIDVDGVFGDDVQKERLPVVSCLLGRGGGMAVVARGRREGSKWGGNSRSTTTSRSLDLGRLDVLSLGGG